MLRKQLQDTSSRIPKYKFKLKSRRDKLEAKELELAEATTKLRNLEEKEEFHKYEFAASKLQMEEEKRKLLVDRNEVFEKLKTIYYSLSQSPSNDIEDLFTQKHESVSLVDLLDNLFVKLEMERSNQERETSQQYEEKLVRIKTGTVDVNTKLDILRKDSLSLEEQLKQIKQENSSLYEVIAEKDNTIQVLNRLLEDDSFFDEDDLSETTVMV